MPRMHAIELLPDDAGCEAVRRDWQALRDAGLPSQLDHRGTTNSPHVTAVAAPSIDDAGCRAAAELLQRHLPARVRTTGIALLGTRRVTLVRLVSVPDALVRAVLDLRGTVPGSAHLGWLPHVTLARHLDPAQVARAVAVVGHEDVELTLATARHWDPDAGIVTIL